MLFEGSIWGEHPKRKDRNGVQEVRETDTKVCGSCDVCEETQERECVQESVPLDKNKAELFLSREMLPAEETK